MIPAVVGELDAATDMPDVFVDEGWLVICERSFVFDWLEILTFNGGGVDDDEEVDCWWQDPVICCCCCCCCGPDDPFADIVLFIRSIMQWMGKVLRAKIINKKIKKKQLLNLYQNILLLKDW